MKPIQGFRRIFSYKFWKWWNPIIYKCSVSRVTFANGDYDDLLASTSALKNSKSITRADVYKKVVVKALEFHSLKPDPNIMYIVIAAG